MGGWSWPEKAAPQHRERNGAWGRTQGCGSRRLRSDGQEGCAEAPHPDGPNTIVQMDERGGPGREESHAGWVTLCNCCEVMGSQDKLKARMSQGGRSPGRAGPAEGSTGPAEGISVWGVTGGVVGRDGQMRTDATLRYAVVQRSTRS